MIVSHRRRFVFVKTFKTAGSSLEVALSKYCGKGDILTPLDPGEEARRRAVAGLGAQNFGKPLRRYTAEDVGRLLRLRRRAERFSEHSPAWQVRKLLGPATWDRYFTFAVVRNPYDRCLSRFYYSRKVEQDRGKVKAWDLEDLDQYLRYNPWFINENWAMYTQNDRVLVDFLVRYEHLEEDLAEVGRRIGLPGSLPDDLRGIASKRGIRPAADDAARLSPAAQRMVADLCAPEIAMFGYTADGFAAAAEAVPQAAPQAAAPAGGGGGGKPGPGPRGLRDVTTTALAALPLAAGLVAAVADGQG